ncbi:BolA family protein [Moraxella porci]|uniref:BolA family transcriptional regulator n=1 Tax=Moraxella porci DSM 25326 TaxID=573983 RepID=A0A1T0CUT6_9GAMM|nr:BolA family protein [Moraxella porci]MDH2274379.1 BolA family transcriptional regulator [Moraxella porci]OOS26103.1 BolA family transcriptional regulator [Moraxella porci DSM 25326]
MTNTTTALQSAMASLSPTHLTLENESHMHAGYFEGKESHFKLVIVSQAFDGLRLAARHQKVYAEVAPYLTANGGTVHALAIHAYTPDEWAGMTQAPDSPLCASRR